MTPLSAILGGSYCPLCRKRISVVMESEDGTRDVYVHDDGTPSCERVRKLKTIEIKS